MIKRKNELQAKINENMRGGEGSVRLDALLTTEEIYNKGRLYSKISVSPSGSIGFHVHENEMEAFYIIKGIGEFDDNGEKSEVYPGDVLYTPSGHGHSIKNLSDAEELEMVALILGV